MVTNLAVPAATLKLGNSLQWLTYLRKVPYDNDSFMIEGALRARSGKAPRNSMPPPCGIRACPPTPPLPGRPIHLPVRKPHPVLVSSFNVQAWLMNSWAISLNSSLQVPPNPVEVKVSPDSQPSHHMIGLWVTSPHPGTHQAWVTSGK